MWIIAHLQLLLLGYQITDADKLEKVFQSFGEENAADEYKAKEIEDVEGSREDDEPEGEPLAGGVDAPSADESNAEENADEDAAAQEEDEASESNENQMKNIKMTNSLNLNLNLSHEE